jgi:hypothetical protein
LLEELRGYLKKYRGRFGIGTCTYGQPLSTFLDGESNIRQIEYAIRTDEKQLGCTPVVYLMSEHAMHSQIPQILAGLGFQGAIMRIFPTPTADMKTLPNDFTVRMPWGYCGNEIWNPRLGGAKTTGAGRGTAGPGNTETSSPEPPRDGCKSDTAI